MKFHFLSSKNTEAKEAEKKLVDMYGQNSAKEADCIVPIGGDGLLLKSLHSLNNLNKPFVLDMACGKMGDFFKYVKNDVYCLVGLDINGDNLHNKIDGAATRIMNNSNLKCKFSKNLNNSSSQAREGKKKIRLRRLRSRKSGLR
mgnify:CR=1 FL=1